MINVVFMMIMITITTANIATPLLLYFSRHHYQSRYYHYQHNQRTQKKYNKASHQTHQDYKTTTRITPLPRDPHLPLPGHPLLSRIRVNNTRKDLRGRKRDVSFLQER